MQYNEYHVVSNKTKLLSCFTHLPALSDNCVCIEVEVELILLFNSVISSAERFVGEEPMQHSLN